MYCTVLYMNYVQQKIVKDKTENKNKRKSISILYPPLITNPKFFFLLQKVSFSLEVKRYRLKQ